MKFITAIKNWWKRFTMNPTEAYLSASTDLADLERRVRHLAYNGYNKTNGVQ